MVPEGIYGTTPATPALQEYGITGTTLALTKGAIQSERISPDRQVKDVRAGNRQVGGDFSVEFAFAEFDLLLQAVFCGTWAADLLAPGVIRRSFSVLRHFTDMPDGAGKPWHRFTGVELNTFAITVTPSAIVKATFGAMGQDWFLETAAPTDSTFPAVNQNRAFDSFTGAVTIDGNPIATVTEIQLTLNNGLDPRFVLFQPITNRPKIGKTRVTGQMTLYFENSALLEAFKNAETKNLEFSLTDLEGNVYGFSLPSIFPTGGKVDVSGEADITIPFPFSAIYDSGVGPAFQIERIPFV